MRAGKRYKHYKGGIYTYICDAKGTETGEWSVIYADETGQVWARPSSMFHGILEDGVTKRFELITEAEETKNV